MLKAATLSHCIYSVPLNYIITLLLLVVFCCAGSTDGLAQDLPDNYAVSSDGTQVERRQSKRGRLYQLDTVRTIAITFDDPDWWDNVQDDRVLATVIFDGDTLRDVGVEVKGSSSDFANFTMKKSFDLSFDFIHDDQKLAGFERTNLHCGIYDASHIREVLFYEIGGYYVPVAKSNYVHLTINGQNWGIYTNTQQLNKDFLQEWFAGEIGPRWRGESPYGRVGADTTCFNVADTNGRQATGSALHYMGDDSLSYVNFYTPKGSHDADRWSELIAFAEVLNTVSDADLIDSLGQVLDLDEALWFLAHEIVFGDEDSYVYKAQSDYYIYKHAETNRFIPLEYDGNSCLEGRSTSWGPLHRADDPCMPLLHRLLNIPELRERYLAHVRYIVDEYFRPDIVLPRIDAYAALIDTFEMDDPVGDALFTYSQFQSGIRDLKQLVRSRYDFLSTHHLLSPQAPSLLNVTASAGSGAGEIGSVDSVRVAVTVQGVAASAVWLYTGTQLGGRFSKIALNDAGLGADFVAGDGSYAAWIPSHPAETTVYFYVAAEAADQHKTVAYAPQGAEHDLYFYQVANDRDPQSPLHINELLASNTKGFPDEAGEFEDWIELYNSSDTSIDIAGYSLSDKPNDLYKWQFPANTVVPAKGFIVVFADEDQEQGPLHTNFKLAKSGETISILDAQGKVLDEVTYSNQETDKSFARVTDGTGAFEQSTVNTPGASNVLVTAPNVLNNNPDSVAVISSSQEVLNRPTSFRIYPNPVRGNTVQVSFKLAAPTSLRLLDYDLLGRSSHLSSLQSYSAGEHRVELTISGIANGLHRLVMVDEYGNTESEAYLVAH